MTAVATHGCTDPEGDGQLPEQPRHPMEAKVIPSCYRYLSSPICVNLVQASASICEPMLNNFNGGFYEKERHKLNGKLLHPALAVAVNEL